MFQQFFMGDLNNVKCLLCFSFHWHFLKLFTIEITYFYSISVELKSLFSLVGCYLYCCIILYSMA